MYKVIMVVAADLTRSPDGSVTVGPETANVCQAAAEASRQDPDTLIFVGASWSKKYQVFMGHGPMRDYLLRLGVPEEQIISLQTALYPFTTDGEMHALADFMLAKHIVGEKANNTRITVVARWWHAPRAFYLLRARLRRRTLTPASINVKLVWSLNVFGVIRELFALLWNMRRFSLRPVSS